MADRGRKKRPAVVVALDGGKLHSRTADTLPETPPAWLLSDLDAAGSAMPPAAIRFWEEYAPKLNERGITEDIHLPKFAMLCCGWAEWLANPGDYKIINPVRGLAAEFSMDPASSSKLGLAKGGKSPLAALLEAKGM